MLKARHNNQEFALMTKLRLIEWRIVSQYSKRRLRPTDLYKIPTDVKPEGLTGKAALAELKRMGVKQKKN